MSNKYKYVITTITIIILLSSYYLFFRNLSLTYVQKHAQKLSKTSIRYPYLSILLYLISYIFVAFLPMPGEAVLSITGGYLYGTTRGTFLAVLGTTIGATIAFLVTRFFFGSFIEKKFYSEYTKLTQLMKKNGPSILLSLRFIPTIPASIVNYIAALTPISSFFYIITTIIGVFPLTTLYVIAGHKLTELTALRDILTPGWMFLLLILAFLSLLPTILNILKQSRLFTS